MATGHGLSTVRHQIHLQVARWRIVPVVEGPHGYALSEGCVDRRSSSSLLGNGSNRLEQPVHCGHADAERSRSAIACRSSCLVFKLNCLPLLWPVILYWDGYHFHEAT